jgi:hypothetical protein
LPGVLSVSVSLAGPQQLRSLDISAAPSASGIIIANSAAKVLRQHSLAFDIEMIHVAFGDGPHEPPPRPLPSFAPERPRFLTLHDLTIARSGSRVTCTVALRRSDDTFEGAAVELDTETGRIRAAARATLAAAERADDNLVLGLEGTALLELFGRRYVAASVEAAFNRRFVILAGLAPVDPSRSPEEAGCLAALRALDRSNVP